MIRVNTNSRAIHGALMAFAGIGDGSIRRHSQGSSIVEGKYCVVSVFRHVLYTFDECCATKSIGLIMEYGL